FLFFFFQAEDGIRDRNVTGVQTCALPISKCTTTFTASSGGNATITGNYNRSNNNWANNTTGTLLVTVNQAPAITSANSTVFKVGTAGTFTVAASGFPASTFTQTGALPSGVTFNGI